MDQICRITRGSSPRPINEWIDATGTPWVKIADASRSNSRFIDETREFIKNEGRRFSVVVHPGDLILSNSATPGIPKFMRLEACIHDGWMLLRDFKEVTPEFLFYRLLFDRKKLVGLGNGSVFTNLKTDILKSHVIQLPDLDEQRRIAGALGALDDLIETNQRLADNLRNLASAEFQRMVRTSTESIPLSEVLDLKYGKALPARDRNEGTVAVVSSAGIIGRHDVALETGPGIVVGRKGTVGSVTWVPGDFFPIDTAFYVETKLPLLFVYFSLLTVGLADMNSDSAVPGLNRAHALARKIRLPQERQLLEFSHVTDPLWDAVMQLNSESVLLRHVRDELLPLLLSGRVIVSEDSA
jgi:hypothetical protein